MPGDRPFGRWGARLYDGLGLLGGLLLAVMTGAVFLQVILRYVFTYALDGLDEVPRYLFVWVVMIGAAAAMQRGEHTALEYFRDRLPPRGQALARAMTEAVGMLLFLSIIKTSFVLVPNAQLQTSAGLGLPLGYVYAAVPVGAALILLPMAWRLVVAVRRLW
ncbi:MAG TPA: TRAP transporter small permease [Methylomirabilota bacterium]|jgi:TRAP-type C4-dicarboxylate transport system permease small subunit|nr:TRAP transporter small permease [Methylomirabilota bacterium]